MSQPCRLPTGGRIDRTRSIRFRFDGTSLTGHPGDTLASALLANGIHLVGRSFKYHRPRGIMTAGSDDPNALVQLMPGTPRTEPNCRATMVELKDGLVASSQNCWPSRRFDVGRVNDLLSPLFPAGFYYKTFMWPRSFWRTVYEPRIRQIAGLGEAPDHGRPRPLSPPPRPLRRPGGGRRPGRHRGGASKRPGPASASSWRTSRASSAAACWPIPSRSCRTWPS